MQIQISLTQEDIETAIREYVARAGMTSDNAEVNFTVTRKGGQTIEASIDLSNGSADKSAAEPEKKDTKPAKTEKAKSFSKSEDLPPKEEKVEESAEEPEPAPTEPPFDPDKDTESANDSTEAESTKESRKLFG